ncbi:serine/threonine-protein phosphatase [bacterium]|nr:serine/threonine-protein phosphatase [bacterium]
MGYRHFEIESVSSSKEPGSPCGDVAAWERSETGCVAVLCDGLGSGIRANLAATLCVSRIMEYLRRGGSLREGFLQAVRTMHAARGTELPYAVFNVARVLPDGAATVLSYESPPPVLVGRNHATLLHQSSLSAGDEIVAEAHCHLESGEGLLLVSDGVTQAGMGRGLTWGWESEGLCRFVTDRLATGAGPSGLADKVHARARELWRDARGDDVTALLLHCRPGLCVNVITGPPAERGADFAVARRFLQAAGPKVISGATTAKIVATHLKKPLRVEDNPKSILAPPLLSVEGIDLVTEGLVTLNQAHNILDEDPRRYDPESGVSALCNLLRRADRVNFSVGGAVNPANQDIGFRQLGLVRREKIVELLAEKLRRMGKLVVIERV